MSKERAVHSRWLWMLVPLLETTVNLKLPPRPAPEMFAKFAKFAEFADFPLPGIPSNPGSGRWVPHPHASESENMQGRPGGHPCTQPPKQLGTCHKFTMADHFPQETVLIP